MDVTVIGASWRSVDPSALAQLTIAREQRAAALRPMADQLGVDELVYLATCNRVEVILVPRSRTDMRALRRSVFDALVGRAPASGEAERLLRIWQGEGAIEHLCLVAAGLDSARMGESEIVGQVKDAWDAAKDAGLVGDAVSAALGEALRVARSVRPLTEGRVGRVSMAELAIERVRERLVETSGTVAVVGVSPMTEQCARALADQGQRIVVVNRTLARAEQLAAAVGGVARALEDFQQAPDPVEAVIVATGATAPVFSCAHLERLAARAPSGRAPLFVDLSVPPNVRREDAKRADVDYISMDEITRAAASVRSDRLEDYAEARAQVELALAEVRRQRADRLLGPILSQVQLRYRRTALEGVDRLFRRELAGVGPQEREVIQQWAETLARRLAHLPSLGLRDLMHHGGPGAVAAFMASVEPALADELGRTAHAAGLTGLSGTEVD